MKSELLVCPNCSAKLTSSKTLTEPDETSVKCKKCTKSAPLRNFRNLGGRNVEPPEFPPEKRVDLAKGPTIIRSFQCPQCYEKFEAMVQMSANDEDVVECGMCGMKNTISACEASYVDVAEIGSNKATPAPSLADLGLDGAFVPSLAKGQPSVAQSNAVVVNVHVNQAVDASQRSGFCCPFCQSNQPPTSKTKITTLGWLLCLFAGLFLCIPLNFLFLLLTESVKFCSQCGKKLS